MAEEERDPLACITENCKYSSSQEEILSHAKFPREDETFPDEEESLARMRSGASHRKSYGVDDSVYIHGTRGDELAAGDVDSARAENLGFRGERKGVAEGSGTKLEGNCEGEREIEPQLNKYKASPLVHCSGKMVIEGEDDREEVVVISGDLKVEKVSSLRTTVLDSEGCTAKLSCEEDGGGDVGVEGEMGTEGGVKRKLEFVLETELLNVEDRNEIVEKGNADKEGEDRGKVVDDEKKRNGMYTREEEEECIMRRGKRELPHSMLGLVWGEGTGDEIEKGVGVVGSGDVEGDMKEVSGEGKIDEELKCGEEETFYGERSGDVNGDGVIGNGYVESGLKEASEDENGDGRSKAGEEVSILDVLRVLVSEKCSDDECEIDVFETAKRCGMTFPRSRFLPETKEDA